MKNIKFNAYHPKWGYIQSPSIHFENNQWGVDFDVDHANGTFNEESGGKLLQSTGLTDKNNKEIFEGDILFGETRNDPKIPTFTGIVEFHGPTASFLIRSEDGFTRGLNSLYEPEVRGNIHEN